MYIELQLWNSLDYRGRTGFERLALPEELYAIGPRLLNLRGASRAPNELDIPQRGESSSRLPPDYTVRRTGRVHLADTARGLG